MRFMATTYRYKARDKFGKLVEGVMGADSRDAVASKLEQMAYLPIAINEQRETELPSAKLIDKFKRVRFQDVNMFTRQLFALQKAGLPILASLRALKDQATNVVLRDVLGQISRDIEAGSNLSTAFGRHPGVFNRMYVNMLESGEVSGRLPETLERLAKLGEHDEVIRMRIEGAMRYPLLVVVSLVLGFLGLVTFVVPKFSNLYDQFTTELPFPTRVLLGTNYLVRNYWWLLALAVAGIIFLAHKIIQTNRGQIIWDRLKLKIPIFGPLFLKLTMSRFCRVTGTLMHSGVPILQILGIVKESVGNIIVARAIEDIKESVNEGSGMLAPIQQSELFSPVVTQMVAVGEETGKLDELLLHIADYYDSQADHTINNLVSLIEPILVFVLGGIVLFVALGIFLPMWDLMSLFKR